MSTTAGSKLSERLGEETRALHREAERTRVMGALLRGSLTRERYALLLRNLHAVYQRMERGLRAHADEHDLVSWLANPALERAGPIARDLDTISSEGWSHELAVLPEAAAYAEATVASGTMGLIAHAWVRYMGDVSGGQILARLVERHYGLTDASGGQTYSFPELGAIEDFKATFRARLDEIPPSEHDGLVEHAMVGFQHSIEMLGAVAPDD